MADAEREAGVADGGEAEQPDAVAGPPRRGAASSSRNEKASGTTTSVDRVVEAAGAGQAHDVPVAPELGALLAA